jgi:predicted nucleotide-binding protein
MELHYSLGEIKTNTGPSWHPLLCGSSSHPAVEDLLSLTVGDRNAAVLPNDATKSGISAEAARNGFYSGIALCRELRRRGAKTPAILLTGAVIGQSSEIAEWADLQGIPCVGKDEGSMAVLRAIQRLGIAAVSSPPRAFIVHGHDDAAVAELKDYLQNTLKWQEPLILREQPSRGKTIIEKFEEISGRVDCVFVLITPDDPGIDLSTDDARRRARQNVIFELGFFYAQLGRKSGRVIVLKKCSLDLPSDIQGVVWIDISKGVRAAGEEIRKEVAEIA